MTRWLLLLAVLFVGTACHDKPLPTQPPKKTNIGRTGGAVAGPNLDLVVGFPSGALSSPTAITVDPLPAVYDPHQRVIPGTAHELGPSGISFARPVTLRIALDPTRIPEGVSPSLLRIHELVDGEWVMLPDGYVDLDEGAVYANTEHFSTYALLPAAFHGVNAGDEHACAIAAGDVWCWGSNSHQQLGTAGEAFSATPLRVAAEGLGTREVEYTYCSASSPSNVVCETRNRTVSEGAVQVATGSHHTCARYPLSVYCWGANFDGQVGNGEWGLPVAPTRILEGVQVNDLDAGFSNSCAVTEQGVLCWGSAREGILALRTGEMCASTPCEPSPVAVLVGGATPLARVSVGLWSACATFDHLGGTATCWGDNRFGQRATGSTSPVVLPADIGDGWGGVSVGASYTCGLAQGGDAWCWGDPFVSQALGLESGGVSLVPARVGGGQLFSSIDANDSNYIYSHTCAIGRSDSFAYCWGSNFDGALGVETAPDHCAEIIPGSGDASDCAAAPVRVATSATFRGISTGRGYTCADAHDGRVYCWGSNARGQLGDGTVVTRRTPARIAS